MAKTLYYNPCIETFYLVSNVCLNLWSFKNINNIFKLETLQERSTALPVESRPQEAWNATLKSMNIILKVLELQEIIG